MVQCSLFFYRKFGQYQESREELVAVFFDLNHRNTFRQTRIGRNYQPKMWFDFDSRFWSGEPWFGLGGSLTPMSLHHVKKFAALSLAKNVPTFARVVNFGGSSWFEIISHSLVATLQATIPVCKIVRISSGANFSGARSISNHSAISS